MSKINIFLGGGIELLHGSSSTLKGYRNDVVDPVISQLNSQEHAKHIYVAKDYSDLTRNVVKGEQQKVYNKYIINDAKIAIFIIDGKIGNITKEEVDAAVQTYRKAKHPFAYIYGINISTDNELLNYLKQEGIYYQHFFDQRDLADKIKSDLIIATRKIEKKQYTRLGLLLLVTLLTTGAILSIWNCTYNSTSNTVIESCTAQLYLMRYNDVNVLSGIKVFEDSILSRFKYDDSVLDGNNRVVFPVFTEDTIITTTQPYFRLKLHNKHRNTIVFVEAVLEVDNYVKDTSSPQNTKFQHTYLDITGIDNIIINSQPNDYLLSSFRQSVAYGEIDDRYFFTIDAPEKCCFRMRVKAKSQTGEYLYSNYIYVRYYR